MKRSVERDYVVLLVAKCLSGFTHFVIPSFVELNRSLSTWLAISASPCEKVIRLTPRFRKFLPTCVTVGTMLVEPG